MQLNKDDMQRVFEVYDTQQRGKIGWQEVKQMFKEMNFEGVEEKL